MQASAVPESGLLLSAGSSFSSALSNPACSRYCIVITDGVHQRVEPVVAVAHS